MRRATIHLRHVGRRRDTLGPVQIHEIEEVDRGGRYRAETLLRPEGL